jgi:preprotein translocase subunit SecA
MNVQRDIIYSQRRKVLDGDDLRENIIDMLMSSCEMIVETYSADMNENKASRDALFNEIRTNLNMKPEIINSLESLQKDKIDEANLISELQEKVLVAYEAKEKELGPEIRKLERIVLLKIVDSKWMEHIDAMDELKNGIGLRAYGQKDPVVQYRIEGADMFDEMIAGIKLEVTKIMLHLFKTEAKMERSANITGASLDSSAIESINDVGENNVPNKTSDSKPQPIVNEGPKIGRNDPCPCGSGKKYKNCHGKNQ